MTEILKKLSAKQRAVYDKIKQYIDMTGVSPTLEELRQMLDLKNINSVTQYLSVLEKLGLIKRRIYQQRSIELITATRGEEQGTVVLPVIASAGCDSCAVFADQTFDEYLTVDRDFLPRRGSFESFVVFRALGNSMNAAGIEDGDYVIAERTEDVRNGDRVVAALGDVSVIKKLRQTQSATFLDPDSRDPRYQSIVMKDDSRIFGKIFKVIKTKPSSDEYIVDFSDGRREYL
jgi:repressor LexA